MDSTELDNGWSHTRVGVQGSTQLNVRVWWALRRTMQPWATRLLEEWHLLQATGREGAAAGSNLAA